MVECNGQLYRDTNLWDNQSKRLKLHSVDNKKVIIHSVYLTSFILSKQSNITIFFFCKIFCEVNCFTSHNILNKGEVCNKTGYIMTGN